MSSPRIGLRPHPSTSIRLQNNPSLFCNFVSHGYSCFLLNITNQSYRQSCKDYFQSWNKTPSHSIDDLLVPFPKSNHVELINGPHLRNSIGLISNWLELDNDDIIINEFSFQALYNEISYATYSGINTFLLSPPTNINNLQIYSSNISKILTLFPTIHLSIFLPMSQDILDHTSSYIDIYSTWNTWNIIRVSCNYNPNLSVSLGAPKLNIPSKILDRWLLEPIKFYLISNSKFISNAKNYPVLHKFNQLIIWKILQFKSLQLPIFILYGVEREENNDNGNGNGNHKDEDNENNNFIEFQDTKSNHVSYIQYLISTSSNNNFLSYIQSFTLDSLSSSNIPSNHLNSPLILQNPIEPSSENLSNYMYKIFEKDTHKYEQYERAMIKALIDLKRLNIKEKLHIFFLGPGRGPLIDKFFSAVTFLSLSASDFILTAIERNPNVIINLNEKNNLKWNNQVNILNIDARQYATSCYKSSNPLINMVISELIGSFGCNELMPECIDSISASDLCAENCIFLPTNLKSYIAPIYSPKLWKLSSSSDQSFDKMYIPMIQEMEILSQQPKEIWSFDFHTRISSSSSNKHNLRQSKISFNILKKGIIHGLSGYFKSTLYADISIDNLPKNPDIMDCVSWLPSYLPIEIPLTVLEDNEISIYLQRVCNKWDVWYEWSIQCFLNTLIENKSINNNNDNNNNNISNMKGTITKAKIPESLKFSKLEIEKHDELNGNPISNRSSIHASDAISNNSSCTSSNESTDNQLNRIFSNVSNKPSSNKSTNKYDSQSYNYDYHKDYDEIFNDSNHLNHHVNFNKIKLCIGVSRVHNLNGSGFKYKYD